MSVDLCPKCGNALEPGARVCTRCGQAVPMQVGAPPSAPGAPRNLPLVPVIVLSGGVLALVLALLLARGNPPAGVVLLGSAAPTSAPAAEERAPAAPPALGQQSLAAPTAVAPPPAGALPVAAAPKPRPTHTPPIEKVYECREGAIFGVDPEEALITIDGATIGKADDWDDAGGGKKYSFGGPGTYYVKLSLDGYRTAWIKIVVHPQAEEEYADIDLELEKLED